MITVILAITIIVIRIIEVNVIRIMNNNNIVIIEIRIEILQGASLGMGSLHIKVIVSDIEGRDYNINIQKYYNNVTGFAKTGLIAGVLNYSRLSKFLLIFFLIQKLII